MSHDEGDRVAPPIRACPERSEGAACRAEARRNVVVVDILLVKVYVLLIKGGVPS